MSRDSRPYASLPSKSNQLKAKSLQTESKTKIANNSNNNETNETQTSVSNSEAINDNNKQKERNSSPNESIDTNDLLNSNDSKIVSTPKTENSKYWAITSV